jgi:AraC-like DNA-binding protein
MVQQGEKVNAVAEAIGYQSEAAFSRAFKKQFQRNAGEIRRREQ